MWTEACTWKRLVHQEHWTVQEMLNAEMCGTNQLLSAVREAKSKYLKQSHRARGRVRAGYEYT
jgi:hypothetical protein